MGRTSRLFSMERDERGAKVMKVFVDGVALLRLPLINEGRGLNEEARRAYVASRFYTPEYLPVVRG